MTKSPFPPSALAQHTAILGKTGSGKTSTAKLAVEQVVAEGARVCILDPIKSDWWGLTSSADGKRPGLPFHILGGPHGHVPLHAATTKARFAAVDCPLEEAPGLTEEQRYAAWWVARFIEDYAPEKAKGQVALFPGLAHLIVPRPSMLTVGEFAIVDIGLRMLQPRELFNAQGFPPTYIIDRGVFANGNGEFEERPLTKTASIRMVGNSVCPGMARQLVLWNLIKPAAELRRMAA